MADGSTPDRFTIGQIALAMGVDKSVAQKRAKKAAWPFVETPGLGGKKRLYPLKDLPAFVQVALAKRVARQRAPTNATCARSPKWTEQVIQAAWDRHDAVKGSLKATAGRRLRAIQEVEKLTASGHRLMDARAAVAVDLQREGVRGASAANIARWQKAVEGAHRSDRLALLVPHHAGRTTLAYIEPEAWELFKADYLRLEQPSAESCYDRLVRIAAVKPEWKPLPAVRTFIRRIEREVSREVRILARHGEEALDRTYPAQQRDRSGFAALEAVNADGHKWDVVVEFPDGRVGRPLMVGFQDLSSGKILSARFAETESSDLVRLAFADVVRDFGIPAQAYFDNGRGFASKYLTGGTPNRYRFKILPDDPKGIITALGVNVVWVTPYHGQAKPIERAWRDFCDRIAKHPAFAGAYTGNSTSTKPENYGSRVVKWDEFVEVVKSEIAAHNARIGRRGGVCNGRSFDQVFNESYQRSTIRKASESQMRTLLLTAEAVHAHTQDGSVRLAGNRYWTEGLSAYAGRKVVLRFDPDALHTGVHCYALDTTYIGFADCVQDIGFADKNAARTHAALKNQRRRNTKANLAIDRQIDATTVAGQVPKQSPAQLPAAGVIAPIFGDSRAQVAAAAAPLQRTGTDDERPEETRCVEQMRERKRRWEEGA